MTLTGLLEQVTGMLEEASVPYMLTGSLAAAFYAAPRATQDIDLVVDATAAQVERLTVSLTSAGFYVSTDAALEALRGEGQFNAIDPVSGWKVDFIIRKSRPFSQEEFARRRRQRVLGLELSLVSPEDLLVAKLEWAKKGGSELQLRDARALLRASGPKLDRPYVQRWIGELGLEEQWEAVHRGELSGPESDPSG